MKQRRRKLMLSVLALSATLFTILGQNYYYLPDDLYFTGQSYARTNGEMFCTSDPEIFIDIGAGSVPRMQYLPSFDPRRAKFYEGGPYYATMDGSRPCWAYQCYDGSWRYQYSNGTTSQAYGINSGYFHSYPNRVMVKAGYLNIGSLNLGFAISNFANIWLGYRFYDAFGRYGHRKSNWYKPNYRPSHKKQNYYDNGRSARHYQKTYNRRPDNAPPVKVTTETRRQSTVGTRKNARTRSGSSSMDTRRGTTTRSGSTSVETRGSTTTRQASSSVGTGRGATTRQAPSSVGTGRGSTTRSGSSSVGTGRGTTTRSGSSSVGTRSGTTTRSGSTSVGTRSGTTTRSGSTSVGTRSGSSSRSSSGTSTGGGRSGGGRR